MKTASDSQQGIDLISCHGRNCVANAPRTRVVAQVSADTSVIRRSTTLDWPSRSQRQRSCATLMSPTKLIAHSVIRRMTRARRQSLAPAA